MDSWVIISSAIANLLYGYLCAILPFRMKSIIQLSETAALAKISRPRILTLFIVILFIIALFGIRSCVHYFTPPEKRSYTIARDTTWYPAALYGKEKNMVAFSNDLLTEIATHEKIKVELVSADASGGLLHHLDNGEYDGILSSLVPDVTTREWYYFSDPFYLLGPVLVVRSDSNITSLKDMEGESIGVLSGSPTIYSVQHYANVTLRSYDNVLTAFNDLEDDVIDGVFIDALLAYTYTTSGLYAGKLKVATPPLTDIGLRLVTRRTKSGDNLIKIFNKGLEEMKADSTYDALLKKWELFNTLGPKPL